jgi:phasin family protein
MSDKTTKQGGTEGFAASQHLRDPLTVLKELSTLPDTEALLSAYRRNIEVFSEANRVALEGAQSIARRHMEILQKHLAEASETMQALAGADTPRARAAKQAALLKRAYEQAVADAKELSDLIQHSNEETLSLLHGRFVEAMDEVKAMMEQAGEKSAEGSPPPAG